MTEVERYHGQIVRVLGKTVYTVVLPDWSLNYVEIDKIDKWDTRNALIHAKVKIVKVTSERIYFVE